MYGLPEGVEPTKIPLLATVNWDGYFVDHAMQLRYSLSYGQLESIRMCFILLAEMYGTRNPSWVTLILCIRVKASTPKDLSVR